MIRCSFRVWGFGHLMFRCSLGIVALVFRVGLSLARTIPAFCFRWSQRDGFRIFAKLYLNMPCFASAYCAGDVSLQELRDLAIHLKYRKGCVQEPSPKAPTKRRPSHRMFGVLACLGDAWWPWVAGDLEVRLRLEGRNKVVKAADDP